jgi:hypothetical protein
LAINDARRQDYGFYTETQSLIWLQESAMNLLFELTSSPANLSELALAWTPDPRDAEGLANSSGVVKVSERNNQ